jgi:hypothetical protein
MASLSDGGLMDRVLMEGFLMWWNESLVPADCGLMFCMNL